MQGLRTVKGRTGPTCLIVESEVFTGMADRLIARRLLSEEAQWWWKIEAQESALACNKELRCERVDGSTVDRFLAQWNSKWAAFWLIAIAPPDVRDADRDMLPMLRDFIHGPNEIVSVLFNDYFEPASTLIAWPTTAAGVCRQLMLPPPEAWPELPQGTRYERRVWGESGELRRWVLGCA